MSTISNYLQKIITEVYARNVRQAIHDAISQCYDDVNSPVLHTAAMKVAVQEKIDEGEMAALTIADGSITGAKLANATIPSDKIAAGAIINIKIADNAVNTAKIANEAVTSSKIANETIQTTDISDEAISTDKIADSAVTNVKLAANAVSATKIADGAITSAKIADGAITSDKLATGAVSIADGSITESKLAAGAVSTLKIANNAVTGAKIANATITGDKLANGAISTNKIEDDAITEDKIASGAVHTAQIADSSITGDKIATAAVTANKIAGKAVITAKLDDGAVTSAKIATGTISAANIANEAITTAKIEDGAVTTPKLNDGSVTQAKVANGAITTPKIADGAITADKLSSDIVFETDKTLSIENVPADAKAVGEALRSADFKSEYIKSLAPVVYCDFTADTVPFALTNCTTSANGLVCEAGSKALYNFGSGVDFSRATVTFEIASGSSFGISMGATCAYVSGSSFRMSKSYYGGTSAPTADTSAVIGFSMNAGELYSITLEKRATTAIATLCRMKTNEEISLTIAGQNGLCMGPPCAIVFTGTGLLCKGLSYYLPLFNHARCLIVGDGNVAGTTQESNPDVRTAWALTNEYFDGDAIISGLALSSTAACKGRLDALLAMGYTFDVVFFCSGTSDRSSHPATSYYQGIIDELSARGIRVIWGIPPMYAGYETSEAMPQIREAILATTNCGFVRFDWATQDANGDPDSTLFSDGMHMNSAGYAKMTEYAVNALKALGI